jgi:hypothetical protein
MDRNAVQHTVRGKAGGSRSYDIDEDVMRAECLRQGEQKRPGRIA